MFSLLKQNGYVRTGKHQLRRITSDGMQITINLPAEACPDAEKKGEELKKQIVELIVWCMRQKGMIGHERKGGGALSRVNQQAGKT